MSTSFNRRDILKGLAGIPVLGALGAFASSKHARDERLRQEILAELDITASPPPPTGSMAGDVIRLGIIGPGGRGSDLMRAAGYAKKEWLEGMQKRALENPNDTRLKEFLEQENLNVRFTAVCDVFDIRAQEAAQAATTSDNQPKIYRHYQDLLADPNVDGVIIATSDHWHAPMAIEALKAGKHVYVEKCMTHKVNETYALREAALASKAVFQVGHQHRQTQSFLTAQDIIKKNILGHINLIEANTNRNDDNGAWQYHIDERANPDTLDWQQFLGSAPQIPF